MGNMYSMLSAPVRDPESRCPVFVCLRDGLAYPAEVGSDPTVECSVEPALTL